MRSIILCEGKDDLWFIAYFTIKLDMNFDYLFRSSYMPV